MNDRLHSVDFGVRPSLDLFFKCHSNLDALMLWKHAIGDHFLKVPVETVSPDEMKSLIDRNFRVKTCWYVAYEPGYIIEW